MVLEGAALGSRQRACGVPVQVAHEAALAISGDAVAEDEVVHPATDVDWVDLNEPVVSECSREAGRRGIEEKRATVKAAGVERRKTEYSGHA